MGCSHGVKVFLTQQKLCICLLKAIDYAPSEDFKQRQCLQAQRNVSPENVTGPNARACLWHFGFVVMKYVPSVIGSTLVSKTSSHGSSPWGRAKI